MSDVELAKAIAETALGYLEVADRDGRFAREAARLRQMLRPAPAEPAAPRTEIHGDTEIECEEPLIAHGAGPAPSRRIRRGIWNKETR